MNRFLSSPAIAAPAEYLFGPFRLICLGQTLYRNGHRVKLGSRARHILSILVERAGEIVDKREILDLVWPDTTVIEANLTVHIAALRQALGDGRDGAGVITTIAGRGYSFIADVVPVANGSSAREADDPAPGNLPVRLTRPIGREKAAREIASRIAGAPVVTITGPGGVGKTTIALAVAETLAGQFRDGIWLCDLAPVASSDDVSTTLASMMQIELGGDDPLVALAEALRDRNALFVIDNCEHLIDEAARTILAVCSACPEIKVMATSREPLNFPGEQVYRLPPLDVPPVDTMVGALDVLAYPAVQLLAERASATMADFAIDDRNALSAALICRRLDGLPLALEFAASLIVTLGLNGVANRLDQHLRLIEVDRRGAGARHRTLEAALDWSYQLLSEPERQVFRRLAIFAGGFTMEAAERVVALSDDDVDVGSLLAGLSLKSLVASDVTGPDLRFRMLETTRAFAQTRLDAAGERRRVADRHSRYFAGYLRAQRETLEQREVGTDVLELDNVRAALRHEMGSGGDAAVALALAAGAVPIWFARSLLRECHARLQEVSAILTPEQRATNEGWDIAVAMRAAEMLTKGTPRDTVEKWDLPPQDAGTLANSASATHGLLTNWVWNLRLPNYAEAMRLALIHAAIARQTRSDHDRTMSAWLLAFSSHHVGDLVAARGHLTQFLQAETVEDRRLLLSWTGFDRRPGAQGLLGVTLCQLGDGAEGLRQAALAERESIATGRAVPWCDGLMWVCTARMMAYDFAGVTTTLRDLVEISEKNALKSNLGVGLGLMGVMACREGRFAEAEELTTRALSIADESHYGPFVPWFVGIKAAAIARQGRAEEALAAIDRFHAQDVNGDVWCSPELLRHEAEVRHACGRPESETLETVAQAIRIAQEQGALASEAMAEATRFQLLRRLGLDADPHALSALRDRLSGRASDALLNRIEAQLL